MAESPEQIVVDLKSKSLPADLLDSVSAFSLFVDELRSRGEHETITTLLVGNLIEMFREVDQQGLDLSLLGAAAPDLLYVRISDLMVHDEWTSLYTRMVTKRLFDELRIRGVCCFYILDNALRADRFELLVRVFSDADFVVISPSIDGVDEAQLLARIDAVQVLRENILYVEPDASVNYLDAVRAAPKHPCYTVVFRNLAPTFNEHRILQLSKARTVQPEVLRYSPE